MYNTAEAGAGRVESWWGPVNKFQFTLQTKSEERWGSPISHNI